MTTGTVKKVVWAGPYTSGERPLSFRIKFDETNIVLTGFDLAATLLDDDGSEMMFAGTVTWDNAATGVAIVKLRAADVAVPVGKLVITRRLQIWAGDGGDTRLATVEVKYNCHPAIGTPPSV